MNEFVGRALGLTLAVILVFAGLACGQLSPEATARAVTSPASQKKEQVVYVTRTGKKYHRSDCRYLAQSKIPMSLLEAKRRYDPCSVCRPPR